MLSWHSPRVDICRDYVSKLLVTIFLKKLHQSHFTESEIHLHVTVDMLVSQTGMLITKVSIWSLTFITLSSQDVIKVPNQPRNTRNSLPEVFWLKRVFLNTAKFTGKRLCHSLKKSLRHRFFLVNFAKFLGATFL